MCSSASTPRGPLTSACRGSQSATSRGSVATSSAATYGGFDTTRRSRPRRASGSASNHDPLATRSRSATEPAPAKLARATASASSLTSVAHTSASGRSAANASASAPEPVPRSATAYAVTRPDNGSLRPRRAPSRTISSIAVSRDHFGLGARDQHPGIDEQVVAEKRPAPEHVLQRFTCGATLEHVVEMLPRSSVDATSSSTITNSTPS